MKKIAFMVLAALLLAVLLVNFDGIKVEEGGIQSFADENIINAVNVDVKEINQNLNDLVFHEYKQGVSLEKDMSLSIENPVIGNGKDGVFSIYVVNYKTGEVKKLKDYTGGSICYRADTSGVYSLFAVNQEEKGENSVADITSQAGFVTEYPAEEGGVKKLR